MENTYCTRYDVLQSYYYLISNFILSAYCSRLQAVSRDASGGAVRATAAAPTRRQSRRAAYSDWLVPAPGGGQRRTGCAGQRSNDVHNYACDEQHETLSLVSYM